MFISTVRSLGPGLVTGTVRSYAMKSCHVSARHMPDVGLNFSAFKTLEQNKPLCLLKCPVIAYIVLETQNRPKQSILPNSIRIDSKLSQVKTVSICREAHGNFS